MVTAKHHFHDVDTIKCVQVGDDRFVTLEEFTTEHRMQRASWEAAHRLKGTYAVFVLNDNTAHKTFISGVSRASVLRVMVANRSMRRYTIRRADVKEIWI